MTATARTAPAILGPGRRLRRRHLWLVPGIGVALFANVQANAFGLGLAPLLIFGIVPHLTVLVGFGQPHGRGQLAPRAVLLFNLMHHTLVPVVVLALAAALAAPFWLVGALAWLSHIVTDWAVGDGLRRSDVFVRRGWLGRLGGSSD
jgi:hypothetical protein